MGALTQNCQRLKVGMDVFAWARLTGSQEAIHVI